MFCKPRPKVCKLPTTTQVMPAQVAPTQQQVVDKTCEYIVPHVYPSHTHYNTNHVYKHVASFPHTTSQSQQIFHQQFAQPTAPGFGPGFGPGAGPGFGPQAGPGFGPQAGPGFGFGRR
ncbi:CotD family spore coat protein [Halalkalibacter flavus]|uniref:CotD family spore coat protein n=1 Tax=Halalkalibacter flavus TaxID=3090668 RepID=UPI002FCB8F0F